ncbi:MAG TPA: hypothetical protein VGI91_00600 [Steroidobacteraceae bacterium]
MSRMAELESRRRVLLERCELQRAEIAQRVGALRQEPLVRLVAGALGRPGSSSGAAPLRHPLTWVVAIIGLLLLRRPRQILAVLGLARSAVALAGKASVALRLVSQLRGALARGPRAGGRA